MNPQFHVRYEVKNKHLKEDTTEESEYSVIAREYFMFHEAVIK